MRKLVALAALLLSIPAYGAPQNSTFIQGPALVESLSTTVTSGGTTTLTATSNTYEQFTGTSAQTVKLPDATTLKVGRRFYILNKSTGTLLVQDGSASPLQTIIGGFTSRVTLVSNSTAAGTWDLDSVAAMTSVTGDVVGSGPGATATTIASGAVTNSKLANMAAHTYKGNNTGSSGAPLDLTATQLTAELNAFVGDSGSGGTKGLVPAPAAGDATKCLKGNGAYGSCGGTGTYTAPTTSIVTTGSHSGGFSANGSGTYTTPAGALYIKVRMIGGGGGGGGASAGTGGGSTTFGTSLLTASGGSAGTAITTTGTGGSFSLGGVTTAFGIPGGSGQGGENNGATTSIGGCGGSGAFGGGGGGGQGNSGGGSAGYAGATNSGAGGGGGGRSSTGSTGSGGGAGGYVEAMLFPTSLQTYSYGVGSGGSGGPSGGSTFAGGAGADGIIIVTEYYQ